MAVEPEIWLDGRFVSGLDGVALASLGYGALTSFRVEDGAVRGLDLHLERLSYSAQMLFGRDVDRATLIAQLHTALSDRQAAWVRINLFSEQITPRNPDAMVSPRVLITLNNPPLPIAHGQRIGVMKTERFMPEIKHSATMELIHARRMVRLAAFDDAVFEDREGGLTEGTFWNIGFIRGDQVVWPKGMMLDGVAQTLIRQGLEAMGISQTVLRVGFGALGAMDAAFLCNSATPCASISSINNHRFAGSDKMIARVNDAWHQSPAQKLNI